MGVKGPVVSAVQFSELTLQGRESKCAGQRDPDQRALWESAMAEGYGTRKTVTYSDGMLRSVYYSSFSPGMGIGSRGAVPLSYILSPPLPPLLNFDRVSLNPNQLVFPCLGLQNSWDYRYTPLHRFMHYLIL